VRACPPVLRRDRTLLFLGTAVPYQYTGGPKIILELDLELAFDGNQFLFGMLLPSRLSDVSPNLFFPVKHVKRIFLR